MREKYESLSVATLRSLAKARNMRHISGLKKSELVEAMLAQDKLDALAKEHESLKEGIGEKTEAAGRESTGIQLQVYYTGLCTGDILAAETR